MRAGLDEIYAELADEHERIVGLAARLADSASLADVVPLLEQLHELLIDHFSHEQFPGGLYEHLGASESGHRGRVRELVREHCEILSGVRGLVERARSASAENLLGLREEMIRVLAVLEQHERKEHRLAESLLAARRRQ